MDLHNRGPLRGDEAERTIITFRACCGTRSQMRSGLEAYQRHRGDTDFGREVHGARHRYGLHAGIYVRGRGRYLGVGPGLELPTRTHYFEGALGDGGLVHTTPGKGLRRVPVVNFEVFRARGALSNGTPTRIYTSDFEQHLFDGPPRPRSRRTAGQLPHNDEHRAAATFEGRLGQVAVCLDHTINSEQVEVPLQFGLSHDQFLQKESNGLRNIPLTNQAQVIDCATLQQDGSALSEHSLNGTAEEASSGWDSSVEHEPPAGGGEASQDDAQSVRSSVSDEAINLTWASSVFGSEFGDLATGDPKGICVGSVWGDERTREARKLGRN